MLMNLDMPIYEAKKISLEEAATHGKVDFESAATSVVLLDVATSDSTNKNTDDDDEV
jgi:hypothetical protein